MMSCRTTPPLACAAAYMSSRAPREVMYSGTRYLAAQGQRDRARLQGKGASHLTQTAISCSRRALDLCTIWFTANGAAGRSGCWAL
jgi:hypothetical protein